MTRSKFFRTTTLVGALVGAALLSACTPLLIGGAFAGSAMMATDRRTTGAQLEDQSIELKARNRLREQLGERPFQDANISITSYNRIVLLSGEVPNDAMKATVEQAVGRIDNVRGIVNELAVMPSNTMSNRSNDALVTSKVKATFIDDAQLQANAFKVTTQRGIVYLMGRVTEAEAKRAAELTSTISGVTKVVKVVETITEAELADMSPKRSAEAAPATRAPGRN